MPAGLARDEPQRHQRRVGHRVVEVPDDQRQRLHHLLGADRADHVLDPDRGRGLGRHVDLGVALALEARRERDEVRVVLLRERGDGRGVDAAGQERADRDVRAHVLGHRVAHDVGDLVVEPLGGVLAADRRRAGTCGRSTVGDELAAGGDGERRARLDPADLPVHRLRLGDVLQGEVVLQRLAVERRGRAQPGCQLEQRLLLARERHPARAGRVEQRLDAERVARAEHHAAPPVPDEEREHPAQLRHRGLADVVVQRDDDLTVAVRAHRGAVLLDQLLAQLEVVVDLPVEQQRVALLDALRAPVQRLVGVVDVDDRQPVEAEDHLVAGPGAGLVGAAVPLAAHRVGDRVPARRGVGFGRADQAKQTAHVSGTTSRVECSSGPSMAAANTAAPTRCGLGLSARLPA